MCTHAHAHTFFSYYVNVGRVPELANHSGKIFPTFQVMRFHTESSIRNPSVTAPETCNPGAWGIF